MITSYYKKNRSLIFTVVATTLFTYGFMLFNSVIGVDTDGAMSAYKSAMYEFSIATGRWGGELFRLFQIEPNNPYIAMFCSQLYLAISALLWCALFDKFSGDISSEGISKASRCSESISNVGKILFSLLYITSPVWNDLLYFHPSEFFFAQMLCPIIIYFIFEGVQNKKLWYILSGIVLSALVFSIYQAVIPYLCSGVMICFFLQSIKTQNFSFKIFTKVLIVFIVAYSLYAVADLIVKAAFGVQVSDYVNNMNQWGRGLIGGIKKILDVGYHLTLVPFKQHNYALYGSFILLPLGLLFLFRIIKKGWITLVLGLCVAFSVMLLPALGANKPPLRSMFVLPLVTGFLPLFLYDEYLSLNRKSLRNITLAALALFVFFVSVYQAQVAIQVQYSDYRRHNADVRLAGILDERIQEIVTSDTSGIMRLDYAPQAIPIAIFGKYEPFYFDKNYVKGEVSGWSIFAWDTQWDTISAPTKRGTRFMQALGMNYVPVPYEIAVEAAEFAKSMPSYPAKGYVRKYKNIVVVKLSENS